MVCSFAYLGPIPPVDLDTAEGKQKAAAILLSEVEQLEKSEVASQSLDKVEMVLREYCNEAEYRDDALLITSAEYVQALTFESISPTFLVAGFSFSPENQGGSVGGDAYQNLPLSSHEAKIITKIITTMAEKNLVQLMFEKRDLERKGKRINPVHPMKFIGYVFADPYLKHCLGQIRKSHFKWDNFIDGYSGRMKEENANNNLMPIVPGFSKALGADPEAVKEFIKNQDWEGLVRFLL
jgi:hypothetical protein